MAEKFGVEYFEVSAKENLNIADTFGHLAKAIKNQVLCSEVPIQTRSFTYIKPTVPKEKAKKKGCC